MKNSQFFFFHGTKSKIGRIYLRVTFALRSTLPTRCATSEMAFSHSQICSHSNVIPCRTSLFKLRQIMKFHHGVSLQVSLARCLPAVSLCLLSDGPDSFFSLGLDHRERSPLDKRPYDKEMRIKSREPRLWDLTRVKRRLVIFRPPTRTAARYKSRE